ncbi:MAG: DUF4426 domain-containing protein [Chromatiales bacterium]|nr:DUF4426 domain-containing protein [Chromatiales bacterium]
MNTTRRTASLACVSFLLAGLVVGCGQRPAPPAATVATPSEPATSSSKEFGDYVLYFNAIRTDSLTPEIATSYGIVRSANRALVNISMVRKAEGSPGVPVAGKVTAEAVNLNGQFKDLNLREIREGDAIYYIGDVAVAGEETLVITVNATPENATTPLSVKFQRQFIGE